MEAIHKFADFVADTVFDDLPASTLDAAAAAGKLLGLSTDELVQALCFAASGATGLQSSFGTIAKSIQVARGATNGLTAAILTQKGLGSDPTMVNGPLGFST